MKREMEQKINDTNEDLERSKERTKVNIIEKKNTKNRIHAK